MRRSTSSPEPSASRKGGAYIPPSRVDAPSGSWNSAPATPPSGGGLSPRNWRVTTRLNAIMLIPVLLALVLGGLRVYGSVQDWRQAQDAERTAEVVAAAETYAQDLINERDVSAQPLLEGHRSDSVVLKARHTTDAAARSFDAAVRQMPDTAELNRRLRQVRAAEPELAPLRRNAFTSKLPGVETEQAYVKIQHPLMGFANELGAGTGELASYGRAVYSVSLSKAAESLYRSIGTHLLVSPAQPATGKEHKLQLTAFTSYAYLENIANEEYDTLAPPQDANLLKQGEAELAKRKPAGGSGHGAPSLDRMTQAIGSGADRQQLAAAGITPSSWSDAATAKFTLYRHVEKKLTDDAVADTSALVSSSRQAALLDAAIVLAALVLALVITSRMARRMSRDMRQLRTAAFDVAEQRLPMLVDQLSRNAPGRVDTRVKPMPITTTDEIGEVARAFDQVHREAVRLATEQALLRGNVNAIFTNLSRRSQGLIERQLSLITDLENNEADPDQLENLFRLDHLATRMRRNGENLLILSGEDPGRTWNQPVPLVDVLRAAVSEVESYERIELAGVPDTRIQGRAVTDLVHLLAELLENATTFSAPKTKVRMTSALLPDGRVVIEIHDKGIGLTPEDFADINHKLANPPSVDVAVSQRMGLYVVGRLADRHGIRVQLRPSGEHAGTTSLVMLAQRIIHEASGENDPHPAEADFANSRIVPEHGPTDASPDPGSSAPPGLDTAGAATHDEALGPLEPGRLREEHRTTLETPGLETRGLEARRPEAPREERPRGAHARRENPLTEPTGTFPTPGAAYPDGGGQQPPAEADRSGFPFPDGFTRPAAAPQPDHGLGADGLSAGDIRPVHDEGPAAPPDGPRDFGHTSDLGGGTREFGPDSPDFGTGTPDFGGAPRDFGHTSDFGTGAREFGTDGPVFGAGAQDFSAGGPDFDAGTREFGTNHPDFDAGTREFGGVGEFGGGAQLPGGGGQGFGGPARDVGGDLPADGLPAPEEPFSGWQGAWEDSARRPAHGGFGEVTGASQGWEGHGDGAAAHLGGSSEGPSDDGGGTDRVAFDRPGPDPDDVQPLPDAGLPHHGDGRQSPQGSWTPFGEPVPLGEERDAVRGAGHGSPDSEVPAGADDGSEWRNANDDRWQRAEQLRRPKAGGVTSSGLPRRVPQANLVEGAAEQTPAGGPQVSRLPEDVRGRLSDLRRGIQQGRGTGTESQRNDQQGFGPGTTYDQER